MPADAPHGIVEAQAVLESFSVQAAAALHNAALHERLQHTADILEVRVRERTADLEAANKELEAFSYSVSHDLRAPLRAVDGFTKLALTQYGRDMPDDCRSLLEMARCGASEMNGLITALLAFSRSARQALNVVPVAPSDIVDSVLAALQPEITDRSIQVVIGDLPDCHADPVLLKQVYANLLSNAVKYTAKRTQARIEVGSMREGDETVYYVKDNGAGFDPKHAHRLFGVFQRLHRAEEYPGTGVGLATVQRIVVRHGGRIWCQAALGEGATFYFVLEEHAA
jgi:light-regulated signal transduction histidine kinase (bacteriophytochrome)